MAVPDEWLLDKSAFVWMSRSPDRSRWHDRIEHGLVRISSVTALELGYSAVSAADWSHTINEPPIAHMPLQYLTPDAERRALRVQELLAAQGRHREPSIPDLLVAAVAESAGLTVLHVDKDFEIIREITGQSMERLSVAAQ